MNRKLAFFGALIAVPSLAFGQVADAKVKDTSQGRSTSEHNSVGAGFFDDFGSGWVEAYETSQGAYVGYFQYDGAFVCNDQSTPDNPDDDTYFDFHYWTPEEEQEIIPADVFTIGRRNSSASVEGSVEVHYQINGDEACGGGTGGMTVLLVTIDLTSNGVRIQNTDTQKLSGPDFSTTDKSSFSGNGATGTVTIVGTADGHDFLYSGEPTVFNDAEGQIGTYKMSTSTRNW